MFRSIILFFFLFFIFSCAPMLSPSQIETPVLSQENKNQSSKPSLAIFMINVGQGDATLIISPSGQTILIDAGDFKKGGMAVLNFLLQMGISHIDYLFASHYDCDHIGGVATVVAGMDQILGTNDDLAPLIAFDRGNQGSEQADCFPYYHQAIAPVRQEIQAGFVLDLDDGLQIQSLIVNQKLATGTELDLTSDDENAKSMGLLITYGPFKYWTAGDLPQYLEEQVASLVQTVDILHVSHHGSYHSTSQNFLDTLSPSLALISVGSQNTYGHPDPLVLQRLLNTGTLIYQTEPGSLNIDQIVPEIYIAKSSVALIVNKEENSYEINGKSFLIQNTPLE